MPLSVGELIDKSKEQRNRKRFEESLISALAAVKEEPDNSDAWWQVSLSRIALGDRQNAIAALRTTVDLEPSANNAWTHLGNLLSQEGEQDEAKEAFLEALSWYEEDLGALEGISKIYASENDSSQDEEEISVLERIERLSYLDSVQLNRFGNLHYRNGRYHEAIKYWKADVVSSNSIASRFNIGLAYSRQEVGQDADAVDMWRIALNIRPDYEPPQKSIQGHLPHLLDLAKRIRQSGKSLLPKEHWFEHYLNPFDLLNPPIDYDLDDLDAKTLQKLKKALLQEIDLEDGVVTWFPELKVDKSRAIGLCDELNDDQKKEYHWLVYLDKPLLHFLSKGSHEHFLVDEHDFRLDILEYLEDYDNGFIEWLGNIFTPQYDKILSKAIDTGNITVLECLVDGRRWVPPSMEDQCFLNSRRVVDRLIQPLRVANQKADSTKPVLKNIEGLLKHGRLLEILNLLPTYFEEFHDDAVSQIRGIAVSCFNPHDDIDLSRQVIELSKRFRFRSAKANKSIESDIEQIEKLIQQERQHEVKLLSSSKDRWEITKEGVLMGNRLITTADVSTIRWGITVLNQRNAMSYDFLFSVGADDGRNILFQWQAHSNIKQQEENFQKLVNAAYNYLFPNLIERVQTRLSKGLSTLIGPCKLVEGGIIFETKGWIFASDHFVPWNRVLINLENGQVIVHDSRDHSKKIDFPLRETENAPLLPILADIKKERDS